MFLLAFVRIWFLLSRHYPEEESFVLQEMMKTPEIESIEFFSMIRKILLQEVMNIGGYYMVAPGCKHHNSIDQEYYCSHQELFDSDTSCKRINISNWNELDIEDRRVISECIRKELKTYAYSLEYDVPIPHDFFTNGEKQVVMGQELLINLGKLCQFVPDPEIK